MQFSGLARISFDFQVTKHVYAKQNIYNIHPSLYKNRPSVNYRICLLHYERFRVKT